MGRWVMMGKEGRGRRAERDRSGGTEKRKDRKREMERRKRKEREGEEREGEERVGERERERQVSLLI